MPTVKVVVALLVTIPLAGTDTAPPKLTPSSLNWTVPVGVPEAGEVTVTVAVKVTDCPNTDGATEEVTVVVVLALVIVNVPLAKVKL